MHAFLSKEKPYQVFLRIQPPLMFLHWFLHLKNKKPLTRYILAY
jgi:hypothetical protein